jgi:hypothetical protein
VRLAGSAAICGSMSGSVWQCARTAVRQCTAVRLVVYGSMRGSVWLSGSAAVRGCVRQCAWLCAAVRAAVCGRVWLYVAVSTILSAHCAQSTQQRAAVHLVVCSVCGSAAVRVWQCGSVRQCGSGWQRAVYGSARSSVQHSVAVRAAVCGSALGNVRQCRSAYVAVR